jgi:hypothetical protein
MGKFGPHDNGSAGSFFISGDAIADCCYDLETIRMPHDALDPQTQHLRGGG